MAGRRDLGRTQHTDPLLSAVESGCVGRVGSGRKILHLLQLLLMSDLDLGSGLLTMSSLAMSNNTGRSVGLLSRASRSQRWKASQPDGQQEQNATVR